VTNQDSGFDDVAAQNADEWAREPGGWAEQPEDVAADHARDAEVPPFVGGMMPEGTPQQRRWADEGGQHPDTSSRQGQGQGQGQGMPPDQYRRSQQYGPGGEYDSQGEEPYGRRGTPPEYEPPRDRADRESGNRDEEGRYSEQQPHIP
jgi:hypothetical protein